MKKVVFVSALALLCAGCSTTKLVPVPYMPEAPEILMKKPKELQTIKQEQPATQEAEKKDG